MAERLFVLVVCLAAVALAATKPDYSGNYAAQQKKDNKAVTVALRVVQTESAVEVTRIHGDKSVTHRFPLDGTEGDYTTETGALGKCKAQLKDDTLVLESVVASRMNANTPSLRFILSNSGASPLMLRHSLSKRRLSVPTCPLT